MTNIRILHVRGINEEDTWYFESLQQQLDYFATVDEYIDIPDAYYPPYYRNEIRLSVNDVPFNNSFNYLILQFNDKNYYYFIKGISYITQELYSISITMDTIQTFMFDTRINYCTIERQHIDLFDRNQFELGNYVINRDYIRENFSNGCFIQNDYRAFNNTITKDDWFVIGHYTEYQDSLSPSQQKYALANSFIVDEDVARRNITSTYIKFVPLIDINYTVQQGDSTIHRAYFGGDWFLSYNDEPCLKDLFIAPFNPFNDINIYRDAITGERYLNYSTAFRINQYPYDDSPSVLQKPLVMWNWDAIKLRVYDNKISIPMFDEDNFNATSYNPYCIPQLLDENYINYIFGSSSFNTSYPLHEVKNDSLYTHHMFDISSGNRIYSMNEKQNSIYSRKNSIVVDGNVITYDIKNDAYKTYDASNKMRWLSIVNDATLGSINSGLSKSNSSYSSSDLSSGMVAYKDKRNYTRWNKPDIYKSKSSSIGDRLSGVSDIGVNPIKPAQTLINAATGELNKMFTPDKIVSNGTISSELSQIYTIYLETNIVDDFDKVAWAYHINGFLVNKPFYQTSQSTTKRIETECNKRLYFNFIKLNNINFDVENIIENTDITDDIRARYENGIRYWNWSNNNYIGETINKNNIEKWRNF